MESEQTNLFVKLGIYVAGVAIGLAAKLSVMHSMKPLTFKTALAHTLTAFACAWIVWNIMNHYHAEDWAKNGVAVIVGRYGDYILIAIWKAFRNAINSKNKDNNII